MDKNEEMRNERTGLGSVVLGFLAGAISGTAVALLLAPSSGRAARARIGDAYRKSTQKVARLPSALKSAGQAARTAFDEARAEAEESEVQSAAPAATNTH